MSRVAWLGGLINGFAAAVNLGIFVIFGNWVNVVGAAASAVISIWYFCVCDGERQ